MPPRPVVHDGLRHCLCPRSSAGAWFPTTSRASSGAHYHRRHHHVPYHPTSIRSFGGCTRRSSSSSSGSSTLGDMKPGVRPSPLSFSQHGATSSQWPPLDRHGLQPAARQARDKPLLAQMSTHILYEHVRAEGAKGHFDEVMNICRVLVKDRGEVPNKDMYTAVLHSFVSSSNGTAGKVRRVLEEMGFWQDSQNMAASYPKIELDARGCECVLEVLAVHPDYLLRTEILEYMKSRWFTLSDRGVNFIVAGMLRERHFEQALETLEDMVRRKARVENWLLDKAMWILLEFGEVEEAFYVLSIKEALESSKRGGAGPVKLSDALWSALLDAAAQKQLYDATSMVWTTQVQPGFLKPATGTCIFVLMLAAQHGHVSLATDVFRLLTERGTVLTTHHYELLIATYLKADDLHAALSVLLIMVDARMKVDAGTCNPLYKYMSVATDPDGSRSLRAFGMLQDFEAAGRKIPTAAVNACIQASITLDQFEEAIDIYKALHTVSRAGPNTQTFNELLRGCHQGARQELAMFLANEMIQLGLKPDRLTYDRLILVCLQADYLTDALSYYEEMMAVGGNSSDAIMKPRRLTWELLIHKCVAHSDERAVALLRDYKEGVEEPRRNVEKAVFDRFEYGVESQIPDPSARIPIKDQDIGASGIRAPYKLKSSPEMASGVNPQDHTTTHILPDDDAGKLHLHRQS